ncbi:MAG: hypothetical protein IPF54_01285 [Draconibacterium sp.]|nr:hypothetical protein [Draconibacterium sp.]
MTTDFPPIGVVKDGDVPNTMKSDPDDIQFGLVYGEVRGKLHRQFGMCSIQEVKRS